MIGSESTIIDLASGLFTEAYLLAALPTRLATARRAMKQLGLVYLNVQTGKGEPASSEVVGSTILGTLRDSDTGVAMGSGRFAMLLEFTPVEGCVTITGRVCEHLLVIDETLILNAAIASYPVHAMNVAELMQAASHALEGSVEAGPGTVAVSPIAG